MSAHLPIGVFDSGVGGLTVLSALRTVLPHENLLYLGDTARLPYGTKSADTVVRYAVQAAGKLLEKRVKMLVIACNTATAAALDALRQSYPQVTVVGVIGPGAEAAVRASRTGHIAVIATEGTIKNGAYTTAIRALAPDSRVTGIPCPLFVSMAEEGWTGASKADPETISGDTLLEGQILKAVAERYLRATFFSPQGACASALPDAPSGMGPESRPDCLLLGCTHFPPLAPVIAEVVGPEVVLVDSAATTATAVVDLLQKQGIMRAPDAKDGGTWHFLTTDSPERFRRVGSLFLGTTLEESDVELVVL